MDDDQTIQDLQATIRQLKARIQASEGAKDALSASRHRYATLLETLPHGIEECTPDGIITFSNRAYHRMFGYADGELIGRSIGELMGDADERAALPGLLKRLAAEQPLPQPYITQKQTKEGRRIDVQVDWNFERDEQGRVIGFFSVITDIRHQLAATRTLNEQILFLQTLIDTLPHPIFYKDNRGRYLGCNQAFEAYIGVKREDMVGRTVYDIAPKELAEVYEAADNDLFAGRRPQTYETSVRYADGTRHAVIFNKAVFYHQDGSLAGLVGAMLDITERKRAEQENALRERRMRQAQKMEAIGTLAGGIAHDFNNILSAIVGYTEIALHYLPVEAPVAGCLKKVLKAGNRARSQVNQILAFSRAAEQETRPVVVKHIVKEAMKLLRATLPSTIRVQSNIRSGAAIMADPTQIHQVVMNLCTNAAHAMQDKGGRLLVSLTDASLDEPLPGPQAGLTPGPYLMLEVRDTGSGIDPEIQDLIFDPFFTTKKPGEGTGMGLSVVHGIIKDCGGWIQVQSVPGEGATFQAWLPAIEVDDKGPPPAETQLPLGHESILFVDDEPDLVDVGLQMLNMLGYRVAAINDSQKALNRFRQSPQEFDLVITDMTMPRMNGDLLSQHLLTIRPDIPIIICTGYSEKVNEESIRSMGLAGMVYKPLIMKDLAELIRQILD